MEDDDKDLVMVIETGSSANGFGNSTANGTHDTMLNGNGFVASMSDDDEDLDDTAASPIEVQRRGLLPTGVCYDDRMKLHSNADFGPNPHHPEDPARIVEIFNTFKKAGLIFTGKHEYLRVIVKENPAKYMWRILAREATKEEICLVHHPRHYQWVQGLSTMPTSELRKLSAVLDQGRDSLYVGSLTFEASIISAGGAIETCKKVVAGEVKNAFAIIRPPGHHAEYDRAMGFCLFNNVPIAAKVCQVEYPEQCRKILIFDWDVHHGNGVQNMFYDDPNVLYMSTHVYSNGEFYPGKPDNPMSPDGGVEHCGAGAGLGKNVNIGWHAQGMGDGEYMAAFQKIVMPISQEFNPDLVIVSAGFDAADGDEIGGCFVSPACYAHMTHMLMSLANGKVAVCLEGGYNLKSISESALAVARTLMGEPPPRITIPPISPETAAVIHQVQAHQAPYWNCMRPGIVDVHELQNLEAERVHDVLRSYQRQKLSGQHGMVPLYIQRNALFKSYENQVLVTRGIHDRRKVLLVVHDPCVVPRESIRPILADAAHRPALYAQPDPSTNVIEPHNAWLSDGVTPYVGWAIEKGFGVMDINIPKYITRPEDTDAYTAPMNDRAQQAQIQELMCYVWDNYVQLYANVDEIFFVGVGDAYLGIKLLLMNRDVKHRVAGIVNFVDGNHLRSVKSETDPELSGWYKDHSCVYVANNHACWDSPVFTSKAKRRSYGKVVRSKVTGLRNMLREHLTDVQEWILQRSKAVDDSTDEEIA